MKCISSANQSNISTSKASTSLKDASWSRFEDMGFSSTIEESDGEDDGYMLSPKRTSGAPSTMRTAARSDAADAGRPTTPSWADFLSSGFIDENGNKSPSTTLLPPDKILPRINTTPRGQSSQSHRRNLEAEAQLEPGELASIVKVDVDDAFWWVWVSSLAGEEPTSRKAVFGRCAFIETTLSSGKWMIMEEQVKGAAPEPALGAYVAEKKSFLGFTTRRGRLTRRKSNNSKKSPLSPEKIDLGPASRVVLLPDQHARIQQAASELKRKQRRAEEQALADRKGVRANENSTKTNSMLALQPIMISELSPAMKWASQYDKNAIRAEYLGDSFAGKGASTEHLTLPPNGLPRKQSSSTLSSSLKERELPPAPVAESPNTPPTEPDLPPPPIPYQLSDVDTKPESPAVLDEPTMHVPAEDVKQPQLYSYATHQQPETEPAPVVPSKMEPVIAQRTSSSQTRPTEPIVEQSSRKLEPSVPEQERPRKKMATTGIKNMFGSKRNKNMHGSIRPQAASRPEPSTRFEPAAPSPVDPNPAIAAARAALEGKSKPQPPRAPSSFEHTKPTVTKSSPPRRKQISSPSPPEKRRPVTPPTRSEPHVAVVQDSTPNALAHQGPPKTRRDEEYDQLSRVNSNERAHAEDEFAKFDQGPLVDQPAFVPQDEMLETPVLPGSFTPAEEKNLLHYSAATEPVEDKDEHPAELTRSISPQDRWAQIRKNAAERAALHSEEQGRPSVNEARTDDGETSGEESELSQAFGEFY